MAARSLIRLTFTGLMLALWLVGASAHYVVREGDTLGDIAAGQGVTVSVLAEANQISDPDDIRIGQHLSIPGPTAEFSSSGEPRVHVVQQGETLASIANLHGTRAELVAAANGITDGTIYTGTELRLEGSGFVAEPATRTVNHVVAAGENLAWIASLYGTTVAQLTAANGIDDPNLIVIGQLITVGGLGWVCPVTGASYFNDWGFARSAGRVHTGNDLFAPRGTEVYAPISGTVSQIVGAIGGMQFRLVGHDGNVYIGSHLDGFGQGGHVEAGTVIGYVGDSGSARGSKTHLHFEILRDGGLEVNPYPTLRQYSC